MSSITTTMSPSPTGGELPQPNARDIEITPVQQMISSCTGSFITSILVTPLDVVKIRLQAQQKEFMKNKCFLYCNGLMDHVCMCLSNGNGSSSTTMTNQSNNLINNFRNGTLINNLFCHELQLHCADIAAGGVAATAGGNKSQLHTNFYQSCCSIRDNTNTVTSTTKPHSLNSCSYHSISFSVKNLTDKQIKDLWYRRPNYFNGTFDGLIKIARYEGITSLWSGLPPTLVMAIPATVMYFTIYDQLVVRMRRRFQTSRDQMSSIFIPALAGGSARLVAATLISPLEMIRTKMQSQKLSYREIGSAVQQLVRSEGILRMWTGLNATLLRDVPFSCLYWLNYENFKRIFQMHEYNFWFSFVSGAASGSIAATITLPFDVVKTYRQIELGENQLVADKKQSKKTVDIMQKIYQERGYRGLFAGISPRLIKVAPACAIMISTYEAGKSFFRKYNHSKWIQEQQKQESRKTINELPH